MPRIGASLVGTVLPVSPPPLSGLRLPSKSTGCQAFMDIVRARYADFGSTLAVEKLRELHDLTVSRETQRSWMIANGLWRDRPAWRGKVRQPRYRRNCVGELIQLDGSEHRWFEDRGPMCTLSYKCLLCTVCYTNACMNFQ